MATSKTAGIPRHNEAMLSGQLLVLPFSFDRFARVYDSGRLESQSKTQPALSVTARAKSSFFRTVVKSVPAAKLPRFSKPKLGYPSPFA